MADMVVLYPSPGHLSSMMELGKLILKHHPSVSVTLIMSSPSSDLVSANPSFTFIPLPEVSLPAPITSFLDLAASFFEIPKFNNPNLHQTLLSLSTSSNIKALIIDFFCSPAFEFLSSRLDIPIYYFNSSGACGLSMFLYLPTLDKNINGSLKDLDIVIEVPGVPKVPSKDMPPVLSDRSHRVYQYFLDTGKQMFKSAGVIVNTFGSLEPNACKAIEERKRSPNEPRPPIFCVGPLTVTGESKRESECLTWLDSQPSRSVLYLCFGSMGVLSSRQLKEMAIGLEKSGVRFLWAVRAPKEDGETQARKAGRAAEPCLESIFPEGFLGRTRDRGFIVKSWAPQLAILNHGSVGGFVTHCGWKSILEAVCAGVPMLGWPLYAEQKMNSVFLVEELKVGLAVKRADDDDDFVSAAELEERVTELMNSDKGEAVRERVKALSGAAVVAKSEGGSAHVAMERLVDSFK
ncbi:hypothetical protein SADUNF_Sadunf12G0023200 [Salix dunnii]|uniref:Glycosyltransferase n=1 Tax=Salix dunnii TaxID=1413687 RepID=A0A835JI40_9ROSI|nr:hypothetical protein SADUNF_Sadunf12G0023200 [Salix dunnii]